jgi:hypothetical protein
MTLPRFRFPTNREDEGIFIRCTKPSLSIAQQCLASLIHKDSFATTESWSSLSNGDSLQLQLTRGRGKAWKRDAGVFVLTNDSNNRCAAADASAVGANVTFGA